MIEFKVIYKSKKSKARLGVLKTPHGEVITPALVPVGTQATVKTLSSEEVAQTKSQMLIANTFHLHLKPGEKLVKSHGGLHKFMQWHRPIMTDSGGFQVFSLGFGRDFGIGKILKEKTDAIVGVKKQPKAVKISDDGVRFRSPLDGREIFLGPKESIKIQEALGADIIFAFDECTSPNANREYTRRSLERTHRWAAMSLKARKSKQALYGIVQGGKFRDLRVESARFVAGLGFDGFGIGGEFGDDKKIMSEMLGWIMPELPEKKPRHLLGIGHPDDIVPVMRSGVDTFDCIVPTHYARHGVAFTSKGRLDMNKSKFLAEKGPLDKACACYVCRTYARGYITHLLRAKEITPLKLLTFHNLWYFNTYIENLREALKKGKL